MNILILEDEPPAARRLIKLLQEVAPTAKVLGVAESIEAGEEWLQRPLPDLIISDIQLADGLSFELLRQLPSLVPVIFTTAFDEYVMEAFRLHSIDYLLKPIAAAQLKQALDKFQQIQASAAHLPAFLNSMPPSYRKRFLIKAGTRLVPVELKEIAWFLAEEKAVYLCTDKGIRYPLDQSLDQLEVQLEPQQFFRLNRQLLAALPSVKSISQHLNGKLKLQLAPDPGFEVFVSREKAGVFKQWMELG